MSIPTTAELLAEVAAAMANVPQQGEDVPPRTYTGSELKVIRFCGYIRNVLACVLLPHSRPGK